MTTNPPPGPGAVVGIGTDLVDVGRFRRALERRPTLAARLFSDAERADAARGDPAVHLAARFGAKEAVMKALGVGIGAFALRDVEVRRLESGRPELVLFGAAAAIAGAHGVGAWHLSLSHTDGAAIAMVVAVA